MEEIGRVAGPARVLEQVREQQRKRVAEWTERVPSIRQGLVAATGTSRLADVLPSDLTPTQFAELTLDHEVVDAEARLAQCARCTDPDNARCASDYVQAVEPGLCIEWTEGVGIEQKPCPRYAEHQLRERLASFGVPRNFAGIGFDGFYVNDDYREEAIAYVDNFRELGRAGRGLHLTGEVGTGKTFLACAVMRALVERGAVHRPWFVESAMLMSRLRETFQMDPAERRKITEPLLRSDLLVLDDLGTERVTDWVREQFGIIVNERWSNSRPWIITSNLPLDSYESLFGRRTVSRLTQMLPVVLDFDWSDQRTP